MQNISNNDSIKLFINNNYDIIHKGENVKEDLSNADEFLLSENRVLESHNQINSLFINLFSTKDDIVLVEAIPSMKKIQSCEAIQSIYLETFAPIYGWDIGYVADILGTGLSVAICIADYEIKLRNLLKKFNDPIFTEDKENVEREIIKNMAFITEELIPNFMEIVHTVIRKGSETFPSRVTQLQESLIKAKKIGKNTFLIAGKFFFNQADHLNDDNFSLKECYNFMKKRNCIVLTPKADVCRPLDEKHNAFVLEMYSKAKKEF